MHELDKLNNSGVYYKQIQSIAIISNCHCFRVIILWWLLLKQSVLKMRVNIIA